MAQTRRDIQQLNVLLRGELAAVEAYQQCIRGLEDPQVCEALQALCVSHEMRVQFLTARVAEAGGTPAQSSGLWGALAGRIERGASRLGPSAALKALAQGERHGRGSYRNHVPRLSVSLRRFAEDTLVPEQARTFLAVSELHRSLQ